MVKIPGSNPTKAHDITRLDARDIERRVQVFINKHTADCLTRPQLSFSTKTMASAARRKAVRPISKSSRSADISVDKLAEKLTSNLVISDVKGKRKVTTLSEEQIRIDSMRAVNSASQQLSATIQSGWKKSSNKGSTQVATAVATAAKHLATLRQNSSGDVDIERAAMTVLGKLVSLELVRLSSWKGRVLFTSLLSTMRRSVLWKFCTLGYVILSK